MIARSVGAGFCKGFGAALALAAATAAAAHDFWIAPDRFHVRPGDTVSLRFLIGDPGAVEHWATEWVKVVALQDFAPSGVRDRLSTIRPLGGAEPAIDRVDAAFALDEPGTHLIAFTSNPSASDLDPAAFNAYAAHEGLALVLAARERAGTTATHGRELYSRRAKALIQVGDRATDTVSRPIGQTLEIVPEINPYLLAPGAALRVRLWFHGAPLAGASAVLERLGPGAAHGVPVVSDAEGRVSFRYPGGGAWKINVVWSYPIADPRADYETIFASLSFGS